MLNNRKARVTTLVATGAATAAAGLVGATSPAQASSVWDRLAQCESGGNWSINTGNGFYGGLQFTLSTWRAYGGSGMPHQASKGEQIRVAQRVLAGQGPGAWPVCSVRAGLTRGNGGSTSAQPQQQQPQRQTPSRSTTRQAPKQQAQPQQRVQPKQAQPQQRVQPKQAQPQQRVQPKQAQPQQQAPKRTYAKAPSVKAGSETVTVVKGDTLAKLAEKHNVSDWRTLWGANASKVSNPNLIFVGQTLHLPA